jgi:tetratricopeptide (TPR) repeat protein
MPIPVWMISGRESHDVLVDMERILNDRADQHLELLKKTTDDHEKYLEVVTDHLMTLIKMVGGAIVVIFAFFQWRTYSGLKRFFQGWADAQIQIHLDDAKSKNLALLEALKTETRSHTEKAESHIKAELNNLIEKYRHISDYAEAIAAASIILADKQPNKYLYTSPLNPDARWLVDTVQRLEKLSDYFPDQRTLSIFIGRLYRVNEEYLKAIAALDKAIFARRGGGNNDEDLAVILFNKACYHTLYAGSKKCDLAQREFHFTEADSALKESCKICPKHEKDISTDSDLDALRKRQNKEK